MATVKQVNAGVDALQNFAYNYIDQNVPGMFQNSAKSMLNTRFMVQAVEAVLGASEKVKE